jgi:hypothetical protein
MARRMTTEKQQEQERQYLLDSFLRLREAVNLVAERKVVECRDLWNDPSMSKTVQHVVSEANDVECVRVELQRTLKNLSERMIDDVTRLGRGRASDDVTHNSSFTNLSADTAVYNFRLRQVHIAQDRERIYVKELFPHLTKNEIEEYVANASELFGRMSAQRVSEITGEIVAAFRAELFAIEKELR